MLDDAMLDASTAVARVIISGIVEVIVEGRNLGSKRADVLSLTVSGRTCVSLVHLSPSSLRCTLLLDDATPPTAAEVLAAYTPASVEVVTVGGKATGVALNPLSIIRSGSGRPVITRIEINPQPFSPHSIALVAHRPSAEYAARAPGDKYEQTIYWSNWAYGAFSIQRCRLDRSHVETVVNNVSCSHN